MEKETESSQSVFITSPVGKMGPISVEPFDICPGAVAMYYPEANVLISRNHDPRTKTPAFKKQRVKVQAYF